MRSILGLATLGLALSCGSSMPSSGGAPFSMSWRDSEGQPLSEVYARAHAAPRPAEPAVAIGVAENRVLGRSLTGETWSLPVEVIAEPAVAGNLAVLSTRTEFLAVEATTGKQLWRLPSEGQPLFGVDDDGRHTVMTLGRGPTLVRVVDRSGKVRMQVEALHLLGAPAVRGPFVLIPWREQFVSAFDIESGTEQARLHVPRQANQALRIGDELYFGGLGLLHFDAAVASGGAARGMWIGASGKTLPGNPQLLEGGTRVHPLPVTARAFTRLFLRPEGHVHDGGGYASSYFKIAFGVDAAQDSLRWVLTLDRPVIGGAAAKGGYLFCTDAGSLIEVENQDGRFKEVAALGARLGACSVSAGDHQVSAEGGNQLPYDEQLTQALLLTDPQMVAAQEYVLEQVRYRTEPSLTKTLIDLIQKPNAPLPLVRQAEAILSERREGREHMLAALERHYDYLADVLIDPPVGALARALAQLNERAAAPLLATHLNEPSYDDKSILAMAEALKLLAGPDEVPELLRFFVLNHARTDSGEMATAVIAVAEKLLQTGDKSAQRIIQHAAKSPMTHTVVRSRLQGMFDWGG